MKIIYINSLYSPYIGGGAEITLKTLITGIQKKGHQTCVISLWEGNYIKEDFIEGTKIFRIPIPNIYLPYGKKKPIPPLRMLWHLIDIYNPKIKKYVVSILKSEKPDLISIHNIAGLSPYIWNICKKQQIPFIQVLHDQYLLCPRNMFNGVTNCKTQCLKCKLMRTPHKTLSNKANAVIGVSNFILNKILNYGYFKKTPIKKAIHNARYPFKLNPKIKKDPSKITLGFIGTIAPFKGIEVLLKVFSKIKQNNWQLLIAGSGTHNYETYLKNKYNDPSIKFLGKVKPEEFYPQLDITVIPSMWEEVLGVVVFESFFFGVPVLGSNIGGIPEMIQSKINGELFNPYYEKELEEKILSFVANLEYWKQQKEQIKKTSEKFFNIELWTKEWLGLYTQVLITNGEF